MAFQREAQTGHVGQYRSMASSDHTYLIGAYKALRGLQAVNTAFADFHAGDFAVFDQIHAQMAGGASKAAGYRIVVGDAASWLPAGAEYRIAGAAGAVEQRNTFLNFLSV